MRAHLLIDNWTLQSVAELLSDGLDGETTHEMKFSQTGRSFSYASVSADLVRLECLFQVLNNLVFADDLFVDEMFAGSWQKRRVLSVLQEARVVIGKPFYDAADSWIPMREAIANELCFCPKVRRIHAKNVKQYEKDQTTTDGFLSQMVWGGAGCLARSQVFKIPYMGHPLREKLFMSASVLLGPASAHQQLQEFVSGERMKVFKRVDSAGYFARLNLPPAAVKIVLESASPQDLLKVALEFRDEFRKLRGWLG